jgi:hypothetical protein
VAFDTAFDAERSITCHPTAAYSLTQVLRRRIDLSDNLGIGLLVDFSLGQLSNPLQPER